MTASSMISEDRLEGKMDQMDEMLYFRTTDVLKGEWDNSVGGL